MLVILDIKNESMKDNFLNFIKTLDYIDIRSISSDINISSSNKSKERRNKFSQFTSMWEDRDIDISTLREKAWKK